MNTRIPQSPLILAAATLCLAGCVTVPIAPLVYGSKTVGGLDISTNTSSANPGVSLSIGYKRDDLALVPVAVMQKKGQAANSNGKGGEKLRIVSGNNLDNDDDDDAPPATDQAQPALPAGTAKKGKNAPRNPGGKQDAMSVFGSFEGRGFGTASPVGAQALAANYFSTGVAAQTLAEGVGNALAADQLRKCFETVKDIASGLVEAERPAYLKKGIDACSAAGQVPIAAAK